MPHVLEPAPSGRAKCRGCGTTIAKGEVRFGEKLPNPFADGENAEMTHWFHVTCGAYRRPESWLSALAEPDVDPDVIAAIPDRAALVEEAELGVAHRRLPRVSSAERASSGRATCRACKTLIDKDSWRVALMFYEDGRFSPSGFVHAGCLVDYCETPRVMPRIRHFSPGLTEADLAEVASSLEPAS
jgi:hypothetical protein